MTREQLPKYCYHSTSCMKFHIFYTAQSRAYHKCYMTSNRASHNCHGAQSAPFIMHIGFEIIFMSPIMKT